MNNFVVSYWNLKIFTIDKLLKYFLIVQNSLSVNDETWISKWFKILLKNKKLSISKKNVFKVLFNVDMSSSFFSNIDKL